MSLICPGSSPAPHPNKQLLSVEDAPSDTKTLLGMSRGAGRLRTAGFTRETPTLPLHGARPYFPARAGGAPRSHPCLVAFSHGTKVGSSKPSPPPAGAGRSRGSWEDLRAPHRCGPEELRQAEAPARTAS